MRTIQILAFVATACVFFAAGPSHANRNIIVCSNYGNVDIDALNVLADYMQIDPPRILDYNVLEDREIHEIRVLIHPPINTEVSNCLQSASHFFADLEERTRQVVEQVGSRSETTSGGPSGQTIQASDLINLGDIEIWITASKAPEPFRSITALTSMLGVDDIDCVLDAACLSTMEENFQ